MAYCAVDNYTGLGSVQAAVVEEMDNYTGHAGHRLGWGQLYRSIRCGVEHFYMVDTYTGACE